MVKFPLKFFYNIGVILENLEFPHFCLDFLQKKFFNIDPRWNFFEWNFGENFQSVETDFYILSDWIHPVEFHVCSCTYESEIHLVENFSYW